MEHDPRAEMLARLMAEAHKARSGGGEAPGGADLRSLMMQLQQQLAAAAAWDPAGAQHHFTLAATDYTSVVVLPRLLPKLRVDAPQITFDVVPLVEERVGELGYDLALVPHPWLPPAVEGMGQQPLFEDRFVCAARPEHPLMHRGRLELGDLESTAHRVVVPEGLELAGLGTLAHKGKRMRVRDFLGSAYQLKRENVLATLPERLLKAVDKSGDLVSMAPPVGLDPIAVWLVFPAEQRTTPPHVWLRMRLREALMSDG